MFRDRFKKNIKITITYRTYVFIESSDTEDINSIDEETLVNTKERLLYYSGRIDTIDTSKKCLFHPAFYVKLSRVFKLDSSNKFTDDYRIDDVHFGIIKGRIVFVIDWKGVVERNKKVLNYEIKTSGKSKVEKEILKTSQITQCTERDRVCRESLLRKDTIDDDIRNIVIWTDVIDLEY